ncbi:MAG: hypothetical protein C0483_20140 [Pirellula sp.]|nr:hypothetical protein [Pirellula sp.]
MPQNWGFAYGSSPSHPKRGKSPFLKPILSSTHGLFSGHGDSSLSHAARWSRARRSNLSISGSHAVHDLFRRIVMRVSKLSWLVPVLMTGAAVVMGAAAPGGSNAAKLSAILDEVAKQGYTDITDASLDGGVWEIDARQGDHPVELHVDPASGKVLRIEAEQTAKHLTPDGALLATIVRGLEAEGYSAIHDTDFEGTHWEIEAVRDGLRRELFVDVLTGKVLSDRSDP